MPSVLMVLDSVFPSLGGGGAESQVRTLCLEFQKRGIPVQVLVPRVQDGPRATSERVDGIPVTRLAYPHLRWIGSVLMLLRLTVWLVTHRDEYAVIHAHIAGNMAAVCSVVGRWLGKPVLIKLTGMTEMRGGILDPRARAAVRLKRQAMRLASVIQATSRRMGRLLEAQGFPTHRILTLPNGVDTARFAALQAQPVLRETLCGQRKLVGIYVGRLEPEKGLGLLIEAWGRAFARRDDTALLVVGDGSLREPMRARARALGVGSQIVFVGPAADVERYLGAADFGVLPSEFEGLSNALLEYMASCLPVVGSRVSGTEDWVSDGETGWLFEPGDLDGLVSALGALGRCAPEEVRHMGRLAHARILEGASLPVVVSALEATYHRLVQAPHVAVAAHEA
jgi:glycosyltransferase involved in cell wall biosynthesis